MLIIVFVLSTFIAVVARSTHHDLPYAICFWIAVVSGFVKVVLYFSQGPAREVELPSEAPGLSPHLPASLGVPYSAAGRQELHQTLSNLRGDPGVNPAAHDAQIRYQILLLDRVFEVAKVDVAAFKRHLAKREAQGFDGAAFDGALIAVQAAIWQASGGVDTVP